MKHKQNMVSCMAVFLLIPMIATIVIGCQPAIRQHAGAVQEKEKNQDSKADGTDTGRKKQSGKHNGNESTAVSDGKKSKGVLTYKGLPLPRNLSDTKEDVQNDKIGEKVTKSSSPKLESNMPVKYIEKEISYTLSGAFDDNTLLDPSNESIYPGAIFAGDSIEKGVYRHITEGIRRSVVLSFGLQGVKTKAGNAGIVSGEIIPNLESYRTLHNQVLSQKIAYTASVFSSYKETAIKSQSEFDAHFKFGVGFAAAGLKAKIGAGFTFKNGTNKYRHLIRFTETFYTVNLNEDNRPLVTDIPHESLGGKMPVYVSSVSYGRIAYLSIETDKTWAELKPYFDAVLKGKVSQPNASMAIKTAIDKLDEETTTTITVIGGAKHAPTTLAQFRKYITDGGFSSGNPGQLIKYKLRFLENNVPAHIKYAEDYRVTEKTILKGKVKVSAQIKQIRGQLSDAGSTAEVFGTIELFSGKNSSEKQILFSHDREHTVINVPKSGYLSLNEPNKNFMVNKTSDWFKLKFNIKERNYDFAGGDRLFVTTQNGKNSEKMVSVASILNNKTQHITLYQKDKPTEKLEFEIEFSTDYVF